MHQFISYIKFLIRSTNQHGVHSPFVYLLLTKCFYRKGKKESILKLKQFRKKLLQDKKNINVKDFGAGSRVFKSNKRQVSAITKNAGISLKRAKLLNKLINYLEIQEVLELGTSVGLASAAMSIDTKANILTFEGCPETASIAQHYFKEFNLNNIKIKVGEFDELLTDVSLKKSFDLIYFDGNHQKEPTLEYFQKLLPQAHNNTVFIFDDIHWSQEMEEAWDEIKKDPKVRVTIDSYYWGLVFFRKEQEKEHFTLRL